MNSILDRVAKDYGRRSSSSVYSSGDVFEPLSSNNARQRAKLVEWLNNVLPHLRFPINASDEDLRAFLVDGTVLCQLLNKLRAECGGSEHSPEVGSENIKRFLSAMDEMGLPRFQAPDLEQGSMKIVVGCLLTLQAEFTPNNGGHNSSTVLSGNSGADANRRWKLLGENFGCGDVLYREEFSRTQSSPSPGERQKNGSDSKFQRALRSPVMAEPSAALLDHVGHKFHEVFQLKQGSHTEIPAARISEMMKSNSLDIAPTQSLLSVVNGILDESIERKNGEIPQRVACLLRKVVQEIERRISTQAEHLRTQNNLYKTREEKYQSRIRVLEALATGTSEETQIVMNQLQQIKNEKNKMEEKKKNEEQDVPKLKEKDDQIAALKQELEIAKKSYELKEKDDHGHEIAALKQELEIVKKSYELKEKEDHRKEIAALKQELEIVKKSYELKEKENHKQEIEALKQEMEIAKKSYELKEKEDHRQEIAALKQEMEIAKKSYELKEKEDHKQEIVALKQEMEITKKSYELKEKEDHKQEIAALKQEMEISKKSYEQHTLEMDKKATEAQKELEEKLKEATSLLTESRNRIKELETFSQEKSQDWTKKEHIYQIFTEFQLGALRELRFSSQSIRQEVVKTQKSYAEEFNQLGEKVRALGHAAAHYSTVLAENRKLHNEVQELKGNIRVYCRIRPFLRGQKEKQSVVEYIGENGELIVVNPSKQGKEGHRSFKFNKVYSPAATQAEVYSDIQPLIQSVLDGYNVCIFAYGQTGSGKTYTMTGPDKATEENLGVNYRALNDLFRISQMRGSTFTYEITVQMIEIYNEQVRDLLSSDSSQKKLGIVSASQPNGLVVPEASMHPVNRTSDVLDLMDIGLRNRAKGSTALNERSSRSHSVVTVHVRGMDIKSGSSMRSSLNLVDLAGSERVDRSEVTGDRLKEAQHINKSLSSLGDVISALAQKNAHVPYRNSKLTQLLQTSLGGQAKTLMFVQLNPEVGSYSETMSTLKFAERVSGVELGAARSSKEGRDVRDLMEQVVSLKDTISQKDEEIEKLQLIKDQKNVYIGADSETHSAD
ncbi:kinesin-like protein KIN-14P [Nicotiana sylvestris]|uniref:Kinesin-4-like isoform X1 n=1 Tax=Nicotiana sylvestris TaxID=4096 RepID=A0A1U7UZ68_NICSY|nr:PREDICTED: kinesin-4-like isoform X1 [Nicotiana sylvestris]XP_009761308.1 PREDICTED: kinesin-4-like isoform X1 [Nicotiana sylvestris]XP_009761309.1 PREDICTED: kinesin-4-like isoform X1 [Nicotiana sylvestris]XP_009761310.1 PREDICTED: kinesin-4-like isoform X1 [Nicotiana sylvestris]